MSTAANQPNEHTSAPMENTSAALVMAKCIESTLECLGVNERQSVQADMGRLFTGAVNAACLQCLTLQTIAVAFHRMLALASVEQAAVGQTTLSSEVN